MKPPAQAEPGGALSRRGVQVILFISVLLVLAALMAIWTTRPAPPPTTPATPTAFERCWKDQLAPVPVMEQTPDLVDRVSSVCYNHAYRALLLDDFRIRRTAYVQQQFQGNVMLWMVVAITLSGVALAGLQLLAASRLAATGQASLASDGVLSLERGKISLRSSVTGLLILVVSLAFFGIFVNWVYQLSENTPEKAPQPVAQKAQQMLQGLGGVGPPPGGMPIAKGM
ncbi:hypothetical protein [Phenylobacterium ferrooxidans]|uniref:Uncharacterized protein n=1 Tax=Phenylobacterium ferrooxidans TaxID=2982689 RepID=A0ABW6CMS2_9CAUL